jgi:hypothetical protein
MQTCVARVVTDATCGMQHDGRRDRLRPVCASHLSYIADPTNRRSRLQSIPLAADPAAAEPTSRLDPIPGDVSAVPECRRIGSRPATMREMQPRAGYSEAQEEGVHPTYSRSHLRPVPSTAGPIYSRSHLRPIPLTTDPTYGRSHLRPIPLTTDPTYGRSHLRPIPLAADPTCGRSHLQPVPLAVDPTLGNVGRPYAGSAVSGIGRMEVGCKWD